MVEDYLPSKKIVALLVLVISILGITAILKNGGLSVTKNSLTRLTGNNGEVIDEIERELSKDVNKTDYVFDTILPNALLVATGKTGSGAFTTTEDIKNYVATIADRVDYNMPLYKRESISVVSDSKENIREYISNLFAMSVLHAQRMNKDELEVLAQALQTNEPGSLIQLDGIITEYRRFSEDLLKTKVPAVFVEKHLAALNNYNRIILSVGDMRKMFTDPMSTLVAIETYRASIEENNEIFYEIGSYLPTI